MGDSSVLKRSTFMCTLNPHEEVSYRIETLNYDLCMILHN